MSDGKVDLITLNNSNPGVTGFGLVTTDLSNGKCRLSWQPTPSAMTAFGHLFVGSMSFAMDVAANSAVYSTVSASEGNVQLHSSSQILRPASAEELIVYGEVTRRGRTTAFADAWIGDTNGQVICRSQSTHQIFAISD